MLVGIHIGGRSDVWSRIYDFSPVFSDIRARCKCIICHNAGKYRAYNIYIGSTVRRIQSLRKITHETAIFTVFSSVSVSLAFR